jgi:hypothetical protein
MAATSRIFIRGGELEKVMRRFHENAGFKVGAALRDRCRSVAAILSSQF